MNEKKYTNMMKRLGRLIWSEGINDGPEYDLAERFAPALLDLGYIELRRWPLAMGTGFMHCSAYHSTQKGRDEYYIWIEKYTREASIPSSGNFEVRILNESEV